jgi:hypothetical protein
MADMSERFEIMAHAMRKAKTFELSKNDQKIVGDMFRHFKDSEFLQSDFTAIDYSWYSHESNMKRMALIESIKENYQVINDCLDQLTGSGMSVEGETAEKGDAVNAWTHDVAEEMALTCNTMYQMGINGQLSEALEHYQTNLTDFLINCYQTYQLEIESEFYQNIRNLSDSRVESYKPWI